MSSITAPRRAVAAALLAAAVLSGTFGCGQAAPASTSPSSSATAAPVTTAPVTSAPATTAPATSESAAADAAGVDAPAASAPVDAGDQSVDGPDVAASVSTQLAKIVGRTPDSVTCPDLPSKVGAKIRCELKDGGDTYGVTVTATKVEGANVAFDIQVDDQVS